MVTADVVTADVVVGLADASVSVTGQTVVETAMISVVTWPILVGQLVTSGLHEVTV